MQCSDLYTPLTLFRYIGKETACRCIYNSNEAEYVALLALGIAGGLGGGSSKEFKVGIKGMRNVVKIPGVVQNRIDNAKGSTRFSPSQNSGWGHVIDRHFTPGKNTGQFIVSEKEVQSILGQKDVITSPVTVLESGQYSRVVNTGKVVGTIKPSISGSGGMPTTWIQILTDSMGNLITTYPIPTPK